MKIENISPELDSAIRTLKEAKDAEANAKKVREQWEAHVLKLAGLTEDDVKAMDESVDIAGMVTISSSTRYNWDQAALSNAVSKDQSLVGSVLYAEYKPVKAASAAAHPNLQGAYTVTKSKPSFRLEIK